MTGPVASLEAIGVAGRRVTRQIRRAEAGCCGETFGGRRG